MENLKAVLEALIFVSETPLSVARIREILGECEKSEIVAAIDELAKEYEERRGGLLLQEVAGGFQFRTNPDLNAWIKKLKGGKPLSLSQPAMETLAIIAYRQPVVKADVEKIRGVDVSGPLKGLLDKKLVRMVGRKDVPGKPILYGTTKKFLEVFNLSGLSELPTLRELKELQATDDSPVQTSLDSLEPDETQETQGDSETSPGEGAEARDRDANAPDEFDSAEIEDEIESELAGEIDPGEGPSPEKPEPQPADPEPDKEETEDA